MRMNTRRWLNQLFLIGVIIGAFFSSGFAAEVRHKTFTAAEIETLAKITAVIKTEFGDIKIKFHPQNAPNHVDNFIRLAESGFYNGTLFHRVIPNFMIQGGDPQTKQADRNLHGTGGPGYSLKAEFNPTPHQRGVLSMARSASPDSAGSQFFICVAAANFLDGKYTVFGEVIAGMAAVDKIVSLPRDQRDNPLQPVTMTIDMIK